MAVDGPDGYPFSFSCRRSGNCCSRPGGEVRVTAADVEAIAAHLELTADAVRRRFVDVSGTRLLDGFGSRCVFLEDGSAPACSIYPVRPEKCRTWPFWPELRDDPAALAEAKRLCPGIESRAADDPR